MPGAVITIQTFGDFLGFNPHCHILCTDGCFYGKGMFRVAPPFKLKDLEAIFQHKIFKMLLWAKARGQVLQSNKVGGKRLRSREGGAEFGGDLFEAFLALHPGDALHAATPIPLMS